MILLRQFPAISKDSIWASRLSVLENTALYEPKRVVMTMANIKMASMISNRVNPVRLMLNGIFFKMPHYFVSGILYVLNPKEYSPLLKGYGLCQAVPDFQLSLPRVFRFQIFYAGFPGSYSGKSSSEILPDRGMLSLLVSIMARAILGQKRGYGIKP